MAIKYSGRKIYHKIRGIAFSEDLKFKKKKNAHPMNNKMYNKMARRYINRINDNAESSLLPCEDGTIDKNSNILCKKCNFGRTNVCYLEY